MIGGICRWSHSGEPVLKRSQYTYTTVLHTSCIMLDSTLYLKVRCIPQLHSRAWRVASNTVPPHTIHTVHPTAGPPPGNVCISRLHVPPRGSVTATPLSVVVSGYVKPVPRSKVKRLRGNFRSTSTSPFILPLFLASYPPPSTPSLCSWFPLPPTVSRHSHRPLICNCPLSRLSPAYPTGGPCFLTRRPPTASKLDNLTSRNLLHSP